MSFRPEIKPLDLTRMAASISSSYGDKGAIIITSGNDGVRIGVHGLDGQEIQEALCIAIYHAISQNLK